MKNRRLVIAAVLTLIFIPAVLALIEAAAYRFSNRSTGTIVSGDTRREFVLYVPRSYDRSKPAPLVISMHGAALWGAAQREISQWNRAADQHGFIVVYPSAMGGAGPRVWHVDSGAELQQDLRFISELIDTLQATYNIDSARIYANGLSNGGGMSFVLSCVLPDRIAAVGMVAAAQTLPWSWCKNAPPVPAIFIHGSADPVVPYRGGTSWVSPRQFPSVRTWTANWARRNGCRPNGVEAKVSTAVTRLEYRDCAEDAPVVLYTVHGGGHDWPGGKPLPKWLVGPASNGLDATNELWAFFQKHELLK